MKCIMCDGTDNVKSSNLFLNGEYFKTTNLCEECIEEFSKRFMDCLEEMIKEAKKNK